ncbi:MAG: PadR family transcriptional regulator [Planctomycetota bacterium]
MLSLKPDHSELVVLAILGEAPSYGYSISKAVAARSDGHLKLAPSNLYPLLTRLEKQGLVSTSWEEVKSESADPDAGGRKRKWYRLSAKGRKRLAQHVASMRQMQDILDSFVQNSGAPA